MKIKAKRTKDEFLIPLINELEDKEEILIEIKEEKVNMEKNFCKEISSLFSNFPIGKINWEKEWHKHLEEKYYG